MTAPRIISRALPQVGGPARTPPYLLPALHFFAALAWLVVAAVLLVWLAPRLAEGRVFDPPVLALVHVLMLGVVGSAIFGALNQFVPGGLGVPLRSVRIGMIGFWCLQAGVTVLVAGFWMWRGALQAVGWVLVLAAVGAVSHNVLRVRRKAVHGRLVGWYITIGHSALGAGMGIAFARIGETLGWWHVDRLLLLAAHAMLGAVGFGTLTAIGVGSRMIPTFLLGPGDDMRWLRTHLVLTTAGLLLFTAGALSASTPLLVVGGAVLVAAGVCTAALGVRWFRRRTRVLDAALWHVASSFAAVAAATAVGATLLLGNGLDLARWAGLVLLLVVGWLVTLVMGVMSKILTNLSYNNLARQLPGFALRGAPSRLLREDWQHTSNALLTLGWLGLAAGCVWHQAPLAGLAAWCWGGGAMLGVANYVWMFVSGRWPSARLRAAAQARSA